ncbi:MAG TPA: methylenetetrahydrofolate reductase C-terminal domain-containing protein [Verrucomicrobiota bacterium]|jgi:methylenetetrahydrofolate reductase (NADPH)|nr:methylenetetrahydrofolate reductase C-terminal domain-containing protein [Verrucomicrobiota bacterium]|tara:strand:- start:860 stop:2179 length:1320 start_codon:yes stop_codon:yes gene_type:complete
MVVMIAKLIARTEAFFKGMMFDCHACGQCVLSETGLVCPMSCPKGLRNGPCGGTLEGGCEIYPDKECVWMRIHRRTSKGAFSLPELIPSPDSSLHFTSSYLNLITGKDKASRTPLPYLDLPKNRVSLPQQTVSKLEAKLRSGRFVRTCEIRAPRGPDFARFREQAVIVRGQFDAVNATAYLNGKPSLPSPVAAAELVRLGIEPISQATCRDHTKTSFISEIMENEMNGVHNMLCLTGDSYAGNPKIKQVFDMDSTLMLYEARCFRETGVIHFLKEKADRPSKMFLGAAINPYSTPTNVPIRRLKQKAAAGADFIQTQAILDTAGFRRFMELVVAEGLDKELFILAGIPVIVSRSALEMVSHIPGVKLPPEVWRRLAGAEDLRHEGVTLAREILQDVRDFPGVAGVHLMLFGSDHSVLLDVIEDLPDRRIKNESECLSKN